MDKQGIIDASRERRAGERIFYTSRGSQMIP